MVEHDQLIHELYDDLKTLSTAQRLQKAGERRTEQIKRWRDYAKSDSPGKKKRIPKIRFNDNIILLEAAARNDIEEVRRLLLRGVDPNKGDDDGLTALHQSCIDDFEEMVKLLIEHKANVNANDTENWTPLHAAATCGHTNICRILIENGANILAVNADQSISFDICEESSECLFYLQREMRRMGITQADIDNARKSEETKIIEDAKKAKESGYDLDAKDKEGSTLLHLAAANGYIDLARYLLSEAVSVNIQDNDGWTPIHAAACWMQPDIVDLLTKVPDIDPYLKTRLDERPLDLAEDPDCKHLLEKLEQEKSKFNKGKLSNKPVNRRSFRGSVRRTKQKDDTPMKKRDIELEKDQSLDDKNSKSPSLSESDVKTTISNKSSNGHAKEPIGTPTRPRPSQIDKQRGCCVIA